MADSSLKRGGWRVTVFLLLLIFGVGGAMVVREYNNLVGFRHEARELEQEIVRVRERNKTLESAVFKTADTETLSRAAEAAGMILERSPVYIKVGGQSGGEEAGLGGGRGR